MGKYEQCHKKSSLQKMFPLGKKQASQLNEKRGNKQCLLDTPHRVTVNNKRLISKCKKSEKKYAYLQKPRHYEELQREINLKTFAPSS